MHGHSVVVEEAIKAVARAKDAAKERARARAKARKVKASQRARTPTAQNYGICSPSGHWARDCPQKVNQGQQQQQQQQTQQPLAPHGRQGGASGSSQSTVAYPHSTYRSRQLQPTKRRVYDIGGSEFEGEVNMLQTSPRDRVLHHRRRSLDDLSPDFNDIGR